MRITLKSAQDAHQYEERVRATAAQTVQKIRTFTGEDASLFSSLRFDTFGRHPLEERSLNFVEQLNQTTTFLVTFRAAKMLFATHPDLTGLNVNLGAVSGFDIESDDKEFLAAEIFAAVTPRNNDKLKKDVIRLSTMSKAQHKYAFFHSPGCCSGRQVSMETADGVQVWSIEL